VGSNFAKIEKAKLKILQFQRILSHLNKASNILKILIKKNSNVNTWVVL
jgi:hypothetical protein